MCGRFALYSPPARLSRYFQATLGDDVDPDGVPSWNVAPTTDVLGLRARKGGAAADGATTIGAAGTPPVPPVALVLNRYRWGLVPWFAKDPSGGNRLFNARAESVLTKPSFRAAFRARRLVVPADGFYEWRKSPSGHRQPYFFTRTDGEPLAFAGLWEGWRDPRA